MRRPAFTLVELLVVVGIIALLVGVLLPALSGARQSAQCIECASNLRSVMYAWLMYAQDNNGFLAPANDGFVYPGFPAPPGTYANCVYYLLDDSGSPNVEFINGSLMPYLSKADVKTRQKLLLCPAVNFSTPNISYVFSADLVPENGPKKITQIRNPAERIPIVEQEHPDDDGNFDPAQEEDTGCVRHFRRGSGENVTGKGNYAYADGHVQTLTPQQLNAHPEWVHIFQ